MFDVVAYGADPAASKVGFNCSMKAGSATLSCTDLMFATTDVGKTAYVTGASAPQYNVTVATCSGNSPAIVTATIGTHTVAVQNLATIAGVTPGGYNIAGGVVTSVGASTVSYSLGPASKCPSAFISGGTLNDGAIALKAKVASVVDGSGTAVLSVAATQSTVNGSLVKIIGADQYAGTNGINATLSKACAAATPSSPSTLFFPQGAYALSNVLFYCANIKFTGPGVLIETKMESTGQGTPVFETNNSSRGRTCNGGSIKQGSTTLIQGPKGTSACLFTNNDIGSQAAVANAGSGAHPLFTTITGCSGANCGGTGVGTTATLANAAGYNTPLPSVPQHGDAGANVYINIPSIQNVTVEGMTLMGVETTYPGLSLAVPGYGIICLAPGNLAIQKNFRIVNNKIYSASTNGIGGNDALDYSSWITDNTIIGTTDTAIYAPGGDSDSLQVTGNRIDNTMMPGLPYVPGLAQGIKATGTNNLFANNVINIFNGTAGYTTENWNGVNNEIVDSTISMQSSFGSSEGINGSSCQHCTVARNTVSLYSPNGGNTCVYLIGAATQGARIQDNTCTGGGISTANYGLGPVSGLAIEGNTAPAFQIFNVAGINYFGGNHVAGGGSGAGSFQIQTDSSAFAATQNFVNLENTIDNGTYGVSAGLIDANTVYGPYKVVRAINSSAVAVQTGPMTPSTSAAGLFTWQSSAPASGTIGMGVGPLLPSGSTGQVVMALEGATVWCPFENATTAGDYVQNSHAGFVAACSDAGSAVPASGQIIGRVLSTQPGITVPNWSSSQSGNTATVTLATSSNSGLGAGQWFCANVPLGAAHSTNVKGCFQSITPTTSTTVTYSKTIAGGVSDSSGSPGSLFLSEPVEFHLLRVN